MAIRYDMVSHRYSPSKKFFRNRISDKATKLKLEGGTSSLKSPPLFINVYKEEYDPVMGLHKVYPLIYNQNDIIAAISVYNGIITDITTLPHKDFFPQLEHEIQNYLGSHWEEVEDSVKVDNWANSIIKYVPEPFNLDKLEISRNED